ncbi:hypothetical protein PG999_008710 [Apiospora kogelbergensis]|uniref:Uncharacterized protein n=1 Tax=Apiospora kogelbergensis TaxID=1337665 RepID=A0AAW0QSQ8_9PEZI
MEHKLRCNSLKCRKELSGRALVTTCRSYQACIGKALADKYSNLTVHLDKVINDANAQITSLHTSLNNSTDEQKALREKNNELAQAYKEKTRKLLQTQELYDKLKRKAMMGQLQDAAEDAIDSNFRSDVAIDGGVHIYGDNDPNPASYQDPGVPYGRPGRHLSNATNRMGSSTYPSQENMLGRGPAYPRTVGSQGIL